MDDLCIICQEVKKIPLVENPSQESLENLLTRTRQRHHFKDLSVSKFVERTLNLSASELQVNNAKYHRTWYANFANVSKVERMRKRYHDAIESGQPSEVKRMVGRPSIGHSSNLSEERLTTRSHSEPYNMSSCIICQTPGGLLHQVETKETGKLMLSISGKLSDKSFDRRLNTMPSPEDAIANDVLYHNLYWANAKKKFVPCVEIEENFSKILSEIELITFEEASLNDPAKTVLDMNIVSKAYKDILIENGENTETLVDDYKKHLKELILCDIQ